MPVNCPRPNYDQISCRIKGVWNPATECPDSQIVVQTGEAVYDSAGQVRKRNHGGTIPIVVPVPGSPRQLPTQGSHRCPRLNSHRTFCQINHVRNPRQNCPDSVVFVKMRTLINRAVVAVLFLVVLLTPL